MKIAFAYFLNTIMSNLPFVFLSKLQNQLSHVYTTSINIIISNSLFGLSINSCGSSLEKHIISIAIERCNRTDLVWPIHSSIVMRETSSTFDLHFFYQVFVCIAKWSSSLTDFQSVGFRSDINNFLWSSSSSRYIYFDFGQSLHLHSNWIEEWKLLSTMNS